MKAIMASKVPSFDNLHPASEASSRSKRSNRNLNTLHEQQLRHEIWKLGLRYQKNVKNLPGKPDIVFIRAKVAVFCDGDFWHGRDWPRLSLKLAQGTNSSYWLAKIMSNMDRDDRNNRVLEEAGWCVIRLWETDIKKAPRISADYVKEIVDTRLINLKKNLVK
jgi:DNA mismatch endonuclease (patch repair protein)